MVPRAGPALLLLGGERPALVIPNRLLDLLGAVHDEGTVLDDRLADGLACQEEEPGALRARGRMQIARGGENATVLALERLSADGDGALVRVGIGVVAVLDRLGEVRARGEVHVEVGGIRAQPCDRAAR